MKTHFVLPKTKTCVVVWYRNGKKNETVINTPRNNDLLVNIMLTQHKVGYSEIRSVKADPNAPLPDVSRINFLDMASQMYAI